MGAMRTKVGVWALLTACGGPVLASGGGGPASGPLGTARFADLLPPDEIWGMMLADLDGDGDEDLIAMTDERDRLAVVMAVPGGYAPPVTLDVCGTCFGSSGLVTAVAAGDYTGDGFLDILLNDRGQQRTLVVPFQDGDFGEPYWVQVGSDQAWAWGIMPDLDGDGRADLVHLRSQPSRLETILSGTPGEVQLREVGSGTLVGPIADITGDGVADAVFRDTDAGVLRVYPGSAAGFEEAVEVAVEPGPFWAVDLDGDGLADLIGAQPDEVWHRLNLGDGTFGAETRFSSPENGITSVQTVGDLSGSGLPDLIVWARFGWLSPSAPWYWPDPFTAQGFSSASMVIERYALTSVRDLDGDGSQDLVSIEINEDPNTSARNATATILINRGEHVRPQVGSAAEFLSQKPLDIRAAELGGDAPALVVCGFDGITIMHRQADGSYSEEWLRSNDGLRFAALVEDLDQDGHPDLIVSASSRGLEIYPGVPGGFSDQPAVYLFGDPSQIWQIALADVTGDGLPDVVAADNAGNAVRVLEGRAGAMPELVASLDVAGPLAVGVGDVDGDGVPEIVAGASNASVSVFRRTTGSWELAETKDITARAYWIDVADADLDGHADIAIVSDSQFFSYGPEMLFGSSAGLGDVVRILSSTTSIRRGSEILITDLNADGLPDIIYTPIVGGIGGVAARVFMQTEPRVFVEGGAIPGRAGGGVIVRDVDADGTPDIVTVSNHFNPGLLQIHSGRAEPCPADITGDGQLNFFDLAAFVALFNAGDPAADFSGDGDLNFFDFAAFVGAFNAGCP